MKIMDGTAALVALVEKICGTVEQLPLPGGNHRRMRPEPAAQLSYGLLVLDRCQGYLGFELGTVHFSLLSHCQILLCSGVWP
ncbi:hypothetical protein ACFL0Q_08405 [Thermodesulfobacteriota bacterium]